MFPAVRLPLSPTNALLALTVTNLAILVPSTPGFVGPFHYFCMQALVVTGVSGSVALTYAGLVHLGFYLPITAWGALIISSYGFSLSERFATERAARPLLAPELTAPRLPTRAPQHDERPASAFLLAMSEAFAPPPDADLGPDEHALATAAAARFTALQLRALPRRLSALVFIGLSGFQVVTLVRYMRPFSVLPLEKRRRWVEAWAYGSLPPARQLFRALRSTILLAFYEQPAAKQALGGIRVALGRKTA